MKVTLRRTYYKNTLQSNVLRATLSQRVYTVKLATVAVVGSTAETTTMIAGDNLSGHRAVCVKSDGKAYYADSSEIATKGVVGVTTHAATSGNSITVQTSGNLSNIGGWSFTTGNSVMVGSNGQLTQTDSGTAYASLVGLAISTDTIQINIIPTITR